MAKWSISWVHIVEREGECRICSTSLRKVESIIEFWPYFFNWAVRIGEGPTSIAATVTYVQDKSDTAMVCRTVVTRFTHRRSDATVRSDRSRFFCLFSLSKLHEENENRPHTRTHKRYSIDLWPLAALFVQIFWDFLEVRARGGHNDISENSGGLYLVPSPRAWNNDRQWIWKGR